MDTSSIGIMKKIAKERMSKAFMEVLGVYNSTALLINSCHIAKDIYKDISDPDFRLSTTQGIPIEYQLPDLEIEYLYKANELKEQYEKRLLQVLCKNYLVTIVSVFDAALEDIYEMLLPLQDSDLTDEKIGKIVRAAWVNNQSGQTNLRIFLLKPLILKALKVMKVL
jgi:hypothetical protein